jgi:hypothetical protein
MIKADRSEKNQKEESDKGFLRGSNSIHVCVYTYILLRNKTIDKIFKIFIEKKITNK